MPVLSLVMATLNRAKFIGSTLESILPQLGDDCELIVFDGASTDDTGVIVQRASAICSHVRYIRAETNSGIDRDYDFAVGHARGQYCWLISDDDLLHEAAVQRVIELLASAPDLIVVDSEVRDIDLNRVIAPRRLKFSGKRYYGVQDTDALMCDAGEALSFIGGTVIRTTLWKERHRECYYGSLFIHMGVIFQAPVTAIVVSEPLVIIRLGNAGWSGRAFEIWMFKYPNLIWGFAASKESKRAVTPREPWRHPKHLLGMRAKGAYSEREYRTYFIGQNIGVHRLILYIISILPGRMTNFCALVGHCLLGQRKGIGAYLLAYNNRFSNFAGRWLVS